jgi:hypothetical protein
LFVNGIVPERSKRGQAKPDRRSPGNSRGQIVKRPEAPS